MKFKLISGVIATALTATTLLGPSAGPGSAMEPVTERTNVPSTDAQGGSRDASPGGRKLVKVIFIKNKKHIRRLNKQVRKGKKYKLPMCTKAIHVWRKRPATYSCCAKCKVKPLVAPAFRQRNAKPDVCIPFTDKCWTPYPYWSAFKVYTGLNNPLQRAKCAATVAMIVVPAAKGYKAIKRAGGLRKFVKRLVNAETKEKFMIALGAASDIAGINDVKQQCGKSFQRRTGDRAVTITA